MYPATCARFPWATRGGIPSLQNIHPLIGEGLRDHVGLTITHGTELYRILEMAAPSDCWTKTPFFQAPSTKPVRAATSSRTVPFSSWIVRIGWITRSGSSWCWFMIMGLVAAAQRVVETKSSHIPRARSFLGYSLRVIPAR